MVSSGRSAGDCLPGERFVCCRRWQDPAENFEDVVVRGRRGPRVSVELLSGPKAGETFNVFASSLWEPDQLAHAKERRERNLRIAELDRGHPVDDVSPNSAARQTQASFMSWLMSTMVAESRHRWRHGASSSKSLLGRYRT
jgi:hypothetical protein